MCPIKREGLQSTSRYRTPWVLEGTIHAFFSNDMSRKGNGLFWQDASENHPGMQFGDQPTSLHRWISIGQRLCFLQRADAKDTDPAQVSVVEQRPVYHQPACFEQFLTIC